MLGNVWSVAPVAVFRLSLGKSFVDERAYPPIENAYKNGDSQRSVLPLGKTSYCHRVGGLLELVRRAERVHQTVLLLRPLRHQLEVLILSDRRGYRWPVRRPVQRRLAAVLRTRKVQRESGTDRTGLKEQPMPSRFLLKSGRSFLKQLRSYRERPVKEATVESIFSKERLHFNQRTHAEFAPLVNGLFGYAGGSPNQEVPPILTESYAFPDPGYLNQLKPCGHCRKVFPSRTLQRIRPRLNHIRWKISQAFGQSASHLLTELTFRIQWLEAAQEVNDEQDLSIRRCALSWAALRQRAH